MLVKLSNLELPYKETPDYMPLDLCPLNSPDLNPQTLIYIGDHMQERVYQIQRRAASETVADAILLTRTSRP